MKARALSTVRPAPRSLRVPLVVVAYAIVFFGLLPAGLWTIGGRLDLLLSLPRLDALPVRVAGALAVAAGAAWTSWSMLALARLGSGWPISHLPPRTLALGGPYAVVRHPIYVGYSLAFAGAGLAIGSIGRGIVVAAVLMLGSCVYALGFEEPWLVRRFGAAYETYRAAVPLLPRWLGGRVTRGGIRLWRAARPAVEWLANRTVLARTGPILWVTYGAFLAAGAAFTAAGTGSLLIAGGVPPYRVGGYLLGLAVSMLVLGRIVWLLYHPAILRAGLQASLRTVGFVSWGGVIGILGFALGFAAATGLDPLWLTDRTLWPAFVCAGLGRLGCLTYGCCYGRPSSLGIRWTDPHSKAVRERGGAGSVPRVPTPLLSALLAFAILPILWAVARTAPPAGTLTAVGLLLYAIGRFSIECLREQPRYGAWGLTSGQIASAMLTLVALFLLASVGGPPGWTYAEPAWNTAAFAPLALPSALAAALVFIVCGAHWRRVGSW